MTDEFAGEGVIIAKTEPRERMDVDVGQWWKKFRVRRVGEQEVYRLRQAGVINPLLSPRFVLETRKTSTGERGVTEDWVLWTCGDTPDEVVDDMMGDTAFFKATTLHPIHKLHAEHAAVIRQASREEYEAQKAFEAACEEFKRFRFEKNQEFERKTRGMLATAIKKVETHMKKRHGPTHKELRLAVDVADARLKAARERLDEVKGASPRYRKTEE
jgi:hypothetical protein